MISHSKTYTAMRMTAYNKESAKEQIMNGRTVNERNGYHCINIVFVLAFIS